jgi:hypothetical protein
MSRYQKIEESIDILVSFEKGKPRPRLFSWQGKEYKIQEVTLVHKERDNGEPKWYFSCFDGINYFKLCFCPQDLSWSLKELYSEGC